MEKDLERLLLRGDADRRRDNLGSGLRSRAMKLSRRVATVHKLVSNVEAGAASRDDLVHAVADRNAIGHAFCITASRQSCMAGFVSDDLQSVRVVQKTRRGDDAALTDPTRARAICSVQ